MLVNEHVFGIHDSKASCGAGMKHLHGQTSMGQTIAEKTSTAEPFPAFLKRLIAAGGLMPCVEEPLGDLGPVSR
jgi:hypothetical protein